MVKINSDQLTTILGIVRFALVYVAAKSLIDSDLSLFFSSSLELLIAWYTNKK